MKQRAMLLGTILLGLASALSYAQAPVPFINLPLVPDATPPGGGEFTLTVNGTGFVSNSVVNWNGAALATQFVSQSRLTATVPAADIATASTGWLTVVTPAPGGGTSNTAFFSVTAGTGSSLLGFTLASSPTVGQKPRSVAVGDFNGDGKLDLAVANTCGWRVKCTVSILLGDGAGNFTLASSPEVGYETRSLAVGDFNGDGKLDLVAGSSVLLGDGTGNFILASTLPVSGAVAVGDFNGDGKLDLAVANCGDDPSCESPGTVSILLGDGTGSFTLVSSQVVGLQPDSVAVGDFNGDGKLDLAVANSADDAVSILLGDGTGNFTLASSPTVGQSPRSVAVGDFNGDGKLDLAVANYGSGTVSILLGDGTGNFTLASSPAAGRAPSSVAVGDFNGDGKLDFAVAATPDCYDWSNRGNCHYPQDVYVLVGDGTGNFTLGSSPSANVRNFALAVGDFNGDGFLDLAVASNSGNGAVSILLGGPPAVGTLFPTNLSFGPQVVGTGSNPQTVTLTNTGGGVLNVTEITTGCCQVNPDFFASSNNCSSVGPGAQCTINVSFAPHYKQTLTGTLMIVDNTVTSPQTVSLTGVGTWVTLLPSTLNFSSQPVGTTSEPQTVTLTNYDNRPWSVYSVLLGGDNPRVFAQTNTCGTSVPAGGSCTVSVTFTPTSKGLRTATLEVFDDGGGSPQTVALSGTGT